MNGMKKILTLLLAWMALGACQDDLGLNNPQGGSPQEGMVEIYLSQPDMPVILTRANGQEDVDNRVDNVILFAFDAEGKLCNTPVQQSVYESTVANTDYRFRAYLPKDRDVLYAVCNYDDAEGLIDAVQSLDNLKDYTYDIQSVDDAFKGVHVMEGSIAKEDEKTPLIIPVTRVVSRHTFTITIAPEQEGDEFKLSSVSLFNVPQKTYLIGRGDNDTAEPKDAAHPSEETTYYLSPNDPGSPKENPQLNDMQFLETTETENGTVYTATAYLFENRRGSVSQNEVDEALQIEAYPEAERAQMRQLYKRNLAKHEGVYKDTKFPSFSHATCLVIEGIYKSKSNVTGEPDRSTNVRYFVYLGHDNFGDFNVRRNHDYQYNITISACDEIDTRVLAQTIGQIDFNVAKPNQPFDAHFNVREVLLYCSTGWEVYVKDADEHPWVELSAGEATYHPWPLGGTDANKPYAQAHLKEEIGGLHYVYIHTDEYVPKITDLTKNDELDPRKATIVFKYDGQSEDDAIYAGQTFEVVQYPAQLVMVKESNIAGMGTGEEHYFYVERIIEEKYKNWGFPSFWSLEMDRLIAAGQFDGLLDCRTLYVLSYWGDQLSDSRKARENEKVVNDPLPDGFEYQREGRQDAYYWQAYNENGDFQAPNTGEAAIKDFIPNTTALGYALRKNRDRNGNGRIDYDEMYWYVPSMHQLEAIYEAIEERRLYGLQGEGGQYAPLSLDGNYWSSTPSVSDAGGITPGRAYYVNMDPDKGKAAIALRDQSYSVIVCRELDNVYEPLEGNGGGHIEWGGWEEDTPSINTPRHNGN